MRTGKRPSRNETWPGVTGPKTSIDLPGSAEIPIHAHQIHQKKSRALVDQQTMGGTKRGKRVCAYTVLNCYNM